MAQQDYPTLNGVAQSWAEIALSFPVYGGPTIVVPDIAAVKWNQKVEVGIVRGTNGGRKTKRTTGQYDCGASITFYSGGYSFFEDVLAERNVRISLVGFDVLIQHTPLGDIPMRTMKIAGCRIVETSEDLAEGSEADKTEVALDVMRVERNGRSLL